MAQTSVVLAFDAYGTLLSTQSIAEKLAQHFGNVKAQMIATTWRTYQLEYTWRLTTMGQYEDFFKLTRRSLKHALADSKVSLNDRETTEMMEAYDELQIFPDVAKTLETVQSKDELRAVVFSNGTTEMVSNSILRSPDLKAYASTFEGVVSVEDVKRFKPAPEPYLHLAQKVGKDPNDPNQLKQIWLVSSNPFDVVGARAVGINAIWVDRAGAGWRDSLVQGESGRPTEVVKSLDQVPSTVLASIHTHIRGERQDIHGEAAR